MRGTQRWLASLTLILGATFGTLASAQDTAASAENPPLFHVDLDRCPNNRPGQVAVVVPLGQGFWLPADHPTVVKYDYPQSNPVDINGFPVGCRENPLMLPSFSLPELARQAEHAAWGNDPLKNHITIREAQWTLIGNEQAVSGPMFTEESAEQHISNISNKDTPTSGACSFSEETTTCVSKQNFCFGLNSNCEIKQNYGLNKENILFSVKEKTSTGSHIYMRCRSSIMDLECHAALNFDGKSFLYSKTNGYIPSYSSHKYIEYASSYILSIRDSSLDVSPISCWKLIPRSLPNGDLGYGNCHSGNIFDYRKKEHINAS